MGQTVNLLVLPSVVRIHPCPQYSKRGSYNGYYASLPSWKWEFDSPTPLRCCRCSSGVERILGKDEVMSSIPIIGSNAGLKAGLFLQQLLYVILWQKKFLRGTNLTLTLVQLAMLTTVRPHLPLLSPRCWQTKALARPSHSIRSITPPRRRSAVSPSTLHT